MKKIIQTTLIIFLSVTFTYGQQQGDTNKSVFKPIIGLNTGIIFSKIYYEIQNETNPRFSALTSYENIKTGFAAGINVSLFNTKYFAFQPEVFYQLINHNINYHSSYQDISIDSSSKTTAKYNLNASSVQISAMFKIKTGKEFKTYFGFGPYMNVPVINKTKGQIEISGGGQHVPVFDTIIYNDNIKPNVNTTYGIFAATGLSFPYKQNNFGVDFRVYFCPNTIIKDVPIRQLFYTICLTYQLKFNNNSW